MMWGALRCHQLMEEFIAASFQGHQRLAGYSLCYLFRNRVTQKEMDALQWKLVDQKTKVKGIQILQQSFGQRLGSRIDHRLARGEVHPRLA
jgi:hypothetical protein